MQFKNNILQYHKVKQLKLKQGSFRIDFIYQELCFVIIVILFQLLIKIVRLKYLLNQSDIFSHFGVKAKDKESSKPITSSTTTTTTTSGKKKGGNLDEELDEDELAMRGEEEDEEEDNENSDHPSHSMTHVTTLTRQPSCINGSMR